MRTVKFLIGLISWAGFCVIAACLEYKLILRFGDLPGLLAGTFALIALLTALWRAPEGYEDAGGFHIGAVPGQNEHVRHAELARPRRAFKMDMARLFSSS
jgi:hypothetical protein